jgi:hypothetical protein
MRPIVLDYLDMTIRLLSLDTGLWRYTTTDYDTVSYKQ